VFATSRPRPHGSQDVLLSQQHARTLVEALLRFHTAYGGLTSEGRSSPTPAALGLAGKAADILK